LVLVVMERLAVTIIASLLDAIQVQAAVAVVSLTETVIQLFPAILIP
jgi:hypothetical protein